MKRHFVYRTIIAETGEFYIGKHSTKNTNDGYVGSGVKLQERVNEGFTCICEIISEHLSEDEALLAERKVLGDEWKTNTKCLNKTRGGKGSFAHVSHVGKQKSAEWRAKIGLSNRKPRKDKHKVLASGMLGAEARRGMKDSPEVRARRSASVSAATMGVPKPWICKRIIVDDKVYVGIGEVCKEFSISRYHVRTRLKSEQYPNWIEIPK